MILKYKPIESQIYEEDGYVVYNTFTEKFFCSGNTKRELEWNDAPYPVVFVDEDALNYIIVGVDINVLVVVPCTKYVYNKGDDFYFELDFIKAHGVGG